MAVSTFQKFLTDNGLDFNIIVTEGITHTAQEAAAEYHVPVSNIVKSLLVNIDGQFTMFLVPGDKRLDLESIKTRFQAETVRMANADEVKKITGYSIGGVTPFGHKSKLPTYLEQGFTSESDLVAAAGANNALFRITLQQLQEIIK